MQDELTWRCSMQAPAETMPVVLLAKVMYFVTVAAGLLAG
jgi:hypothetical protein